MEYDGPKARTDSEDRGVLKKVQPEVEEELVLNPEEGKSIEDPDH